MPAWLAPLAIGAGGSLLNHLLGGNKQQQRTSQNTHTTGTNTSMPTFDPRFQPLLSQMLARQAQQFSRGSSLPQGWMTNATEQVNAANQGARTNLEASLAARGLGTSPVAAAAIGGLEQARQGQIGDLGVQSQLLERQFGQEDFQNAMNLMGLGRGVTSTIDQRTTGTGTGTQGAGSPLGDIGGLLGYLYASGAFGKQQSGGGGGS